MLSNTSPRVRFNWGYHDGANNHGKRQRAWAEDHFDQVYGKGFIAGMNDRFLGRYMGNSDRAWGEYSEAVEVAKVYDGDTSEHRLRLMEGGPGSLG